MAANAKAFAELAADAKAMSAIKADPQAFVSLAQNARAFQGLTANLAALTSNMRAVEAMATPAACRTYNVLMAAERRVAAALVALPAEVTTA